MKHYRWMKTILIVLCTTALVSAALPAFAEFPEKSVKLIVPFPAGGSTDTLMRLTAKFIEPYLGQKLVILNVKGAAGAVGMKQTLDARPDGYTLGIYNANTPVVRLQGMASFTDKDIKPVCNLADLYLTVTAQGDGPYKSMKDLAAAAKKNPGEIGLAMGAGTLAQYVSVMVAEAMNVDMKFVNCGDDAEKKAAVLGGHVAAMIGPLPGVVSLHRGGKFRILAVLSPERLEMAKEIPTAVEQGFDVNAVTPNGLMVAKGTPQDRVDKIASAFRKLGDDQAYQKSIEKLMVVWNFIEGDAYGKRMDDMYEKMAALKKRAGF